MMHPASASCASLRAATASVTETAREANHIPGARLREAPEIGTDHGGDLRVAPVGCRSAISTMGWPEPGTWIAPMAMPSDTMSWLRAAIGGPSRKQAMRSPRGPMRQRQRGRPRVPPARRRRPADPAPRGSAPVAGPAKAPTGSRAHRVRHGVPRRAGRRRPAGRSRRARRGRSGYGSRWSRAPAAPRCARRPRDSTRPRPARPDRQRRFRPQGQSRRAGKGPAIAGYAKVASDQGDVDGRTRDAQRQAAERDSIAVAPGGFSRTRLAEAKASGSMGPAGVMP